MEYAESALELIEGFTLQAIGDPEQRSTWIARLSNYPKWKLLQLDHFTGRLESVWHYLDTLPSPLPRAQDYEPKEHPVMPTNIARDTLAHFKRHMGATAQIPFTLAEHEAKWAAELSGLKELHAKYPRAHFDTTMRSREQDMIKKRQWLKEQGR